MIQSDTLQTELELEEAADAWSRRSGAKSTQARVSAAAERVAAEHTMADVPDAAATLEEDDGADHVIP